MSAGCVPEPTSVAEKSPERGKPPEKGKLAALREGRKPPPAKRPALAPVAEHINIQAEESTSAQPLLSKSDAPSYSGLSGTGRGGFAKLDIDDGDSSNETRRSEKNSGSVRPFLNTFLSLPAHAPYTESTWDKAKSYASCFVCCGGVVVGVVFAGIEISKLLENHGGNSNDTQLLTYCDGVPWSTGGVIGIHNLGGDTATLNTWGAVANAAPLQLPWSYPGNNILPGDAAFSCVPQNFGYQYFITPGATQLTIAPGGYGFLAANFNVTAPAFNATSAWADQGAGKALLTYEGACPPLPSSAASVAAEMKSAVVTNLPQLPADVWAKLVSASQLSTTALYTELLALQRQLTNGYLEKRGWSKINITLVNQTIGTVVLLAKSASLGDAVAMPAASLLLERLGCGKYSTALAVALVTTAKFYFTGSLGMANAALGFAAHAAAGIGLPAAAKKVMGAGVGLVKGGYGLLCSAVGMFKAKPAANDTRVAVHLPSPQLVLQVHQPQPRKG